jgi:low density lipoprotein receptor-related protein 5/6
MYWTDVEADRIQRASLDGSSIEDVVTAGLDVSAGLAVDPYGGKIYWTDAALLRIRRANLDGSAIEDLVTDGISNPVGIALDVVAGKMYWTDVGTDRIERANLDGTGIEDLTAAKLESAQGIALDIGSRLLFWTDLAQGTIQRANLDGQFVASVLEPGDNAPLGIAVSRPDSALITGSSPPDGSIDARQPGAPGGGSEGWSEVRITLSSTAGLTLADFLIEEDPPAAPPAILSLSAAKGEVTVQLERPVTPGSWTTIVHRASGTRTRLGFLPGDVNGDAQVGSVDLLALLDDLNGLSALPVHATDINRSGQPEPQDVLRLLDLLNGAGDYESWNGRTLP